MTTGEIDVKAESVISSYLDVVKNRFLEHCEKLLNDKPTKKRPRLQKVIYVGNYKAEVVTVTIELGDKLK